MLLFLNILTWFKFEPRFLSLHFVPCFHTLQTWHLLLFSHLSLFFFNNVSREVGGTSLTSQLSLVLVIYWKLSNKSLHNNECYYHLSFLWVMGGNSPEWGSGLASFLLRLLSKYWPGLQSSEVYLGHRLTALNGVLTWLLAEPLFLTMWDSS